LRPMQTAQIKIPARLQPIFGPPRGSVRYRAMHGGRGSAKSATAALMAAVWGYADPMRILCVREFQVSIAESFHAELKAAIASHDWLAAHYDVGRDYLRGKNGTEFIFRGLRRSESSIKSLAKVDLTICEEAEDYPETSWLALEATVFRQPKSELWAIWNPRNPGSPVDARFRQTPRKSALIAEINWRDNPFFPPGMGSLRAEEEKRLDPATYAHIWEGAYLTNSDAQVLAGKVQVQEFEPGQGWDGPYFGMDFGFAQDPTTGVACYVHGDCLYVRHEAGRVGLELDHTARFMADRLPRIADHVVRADSARPESISFLRRNGLPRIEGVEKWPGSVQDGIAFLRSFRAIVVHPSCRETISETRLYSYKVDRFTGDIRPEIVDAHNHYIDAIRYALAPLIRARTQPKAATGYVSGLW